MLGFSMLWWALFSSRTSWKSGEVKLHLQQTQTLVTSNKQVTLVCCSSPNILATTGVIQDLTSPGWGWWWWCVCVCMCIRVVCVVIQGKLVRCVVSLQGKLISNGPAFLTPVLVFPPPSAFRLCLGKCFKRRRPSIIFAAFVLGGDRIFCTSHKYHSWPR